MSRGSSSHKSNLWQMPLFVLSLGLFGYAAFLLWDPKPGPTLEERLLNVKQLLKFERPEAAVESLNKLLTNDKLTSDQQSRIHLMFAEALEMYQNQKQQTIPALNMRIIEQSRFAVARGAELDGVAYRRVGQAHEKLGQEKEALQNYKHASALDPDRALRLSRKIIDMMLDQGDPQGADLEVQNYLKDINLTDAERSWAFGMRAKYMTDQKQFSEARMLLDEALKLTSDQMQEGEINYRIGYTAYSLGNIDEAERYLRIARDQLTPRNPLDADACILLGDIYRRRNDPETANSFYQTVLVSHPDHKDAVLARLGRGMCRVMLKQDESALSDLIAIAREVDQRPTRQRFKADVIQTLQKAENLMSQRGNHAGAIELIGYEQVLNPEPSPEFFARLATLYHHRADQLESLMQNAALADRLKLEKSTNEYRTKAGDAWIAHSQKIVLQDDKQQGDSLWRGIDLYDRAGNIQASITALELFVAERPEDALAPDALLRLGKAYQSAGMLDKAIVTYQRNQFRYPKSLGASQSAVPLAQALISKGADNYAKAEKVLEMVLDNNPLLDPSSEDFRNALFELGQLYYRTSRYEEAVARLDEFAKRYPDDTRKGKLFFLTGDSYRKSAQNLAVRIETAARTRDLKVDPVELETARRDRLNKAKDFYDQVVDLYRNNPPTADSEKQYFKLSHFYRADCLYDMGSYEAAITMYDNAAFRFQDDPTSLAAYVQIVNSWCRLGKPEAAKTANERAKWLLKRIPPESFADGSFAMPKEYWEQWLKFANDSGMW